MNEKNKAYIPIGKIGAPYGIKGWLKIQTYTEFSLNILDYQPWYIAQGNDWEMLNDVKGRLHGQTVIVKFPHIDTPEKARLLTGKIIAVPRDHFPALSKDEYYWTDLEGLSVINKNGEVLGKVIYLMESGAHDVLVIREQEKPSTKCKEIAIPYLPGKVILKVDLLAQEIHINWEKME